MKAAPGLTQLLPLTCPRSLTTTCGLQLSDIILKRQKCILGCFEDGLGFSVWGSGALDPRLLELLYWKDLLLLQPSQGPAGIC